MGYYLFNWCVNGFSIMTSFFAELVHTDNGVTCSDSGFKDLTAAQECSEAVIYAKSFNSAARYQSAVSLSTSPTGCIINHSGSMYFNSYPTGDRNNLYRSICRKGNTQF